MATSPSKTVQTALLARQNVASNTVVISSALDVSTIFQATFFCQIGRRATTALTASGNIRIEASGATSGEGKWFPLTSLGSSTPAAESEAVSGTVSSGTNVITVASTTNLTAGDVIYIDNGTASLSEWARIKSIVSNTSVTIEDNLVNAQTGSTIYDQADIFAPLTIDLGSIKRIRAVYDGSQTGQATAVEVLVTTMDSVG